MPQQYAGPATATKSTSKSLKMSTTVRTRWVVLSTLHPRNRTTLAGFTSPLGGAISHEWIGELLLRRSDMPNDLMRAVGLHHVLGERPSPLASLVHAADGIAKEMGMGLVEDEAVEYNRAALSVLQLKRDDVRKLSKSYASLVKGEVRRLVKECMS